MRAQHKARVAKLAKGRTSQIIALGQGTQDGVDIFRTDLGIYSRAELEELEAAGRKVVWIDMDCRGL